MTRRYFVQGALAMAALVLSGCSKGEKSEGDKTPTGCIKETGKPDDDDAIFLDEEELLPGEQWEVADPIPVNNRLPAQFANSSSGFLDRNYMEAIANASRSTNTYGVRNGNRQAFRLIPGFGRIGQTAVVVFSDKPRVGYRVRLWYACRINSGSHRGFVFKKGSIGGFFAHSPYGRRPGRVTVYY